jgi:hypothetical protein
MAHLCARYAHLSTNAPFRKTPLRLALGESRSASTHHPNSQDGEVMIPKRRIYVSAPLDEHLNQDQSSIKRAIYAELEKEEFEPQEFLYRGLPAGISWSFQESRTVMGRCDGALILAFVRVEFELQDGSRWAMPSEYNHYEGALAIANDLPMFVVSEEGVPNRGIVWQGGGLLINSLPTGSDASWIDNPKFKNQFQLWVDKVRSKPRVFLGYCSKAKATADALTLYLEHTLGVSVRNYALDFIAGGTILDEIEKSARECACGIFLFTNDDPLEGTNPYQAAPRDNVVFEAGFFMHARGRARTLIIREDGAKMPADVGGSIYLPLKDRNDISPIHLHLSKFLEDRL